MTFRAHIFDDFPRNGVRLALLNEQRNTVLYEDGVWRPVDESVVVQAVDGMQPGIVLDRRAIEAIRDEIDRFLGERYSPSALADELRAALNHERHRVDRILVAAIGRIGAPTA
ncbi:MAG TPA: hypothetical protein VHC63_13460 [Acidimicrobiales bacterium]|nr:hypothetical protein [Acidimicrobiales bacterium]